MAKGRSIEYKGKTYKSIRSLAIEFGIPPKRLETRIRRGEPEDQWFREVDRSIPKNFKVITYQGKQYGSIRELANKFGIDDGALCGRIQRGLPEEEWGTPVPDRTVLYKGETFKNVKELAAHLGLTRECLKNRIQAGWEEKDWHLPPGSERPDVPRPVSSQAIAVDYLGKRFPTLTALAAHLEIPIETLRGRINAGLPEDEWGLKKESVFYKGVEYSALTTLAIELSGQGLGSHTGIYKKLKKALEEGLEMDEAVFVATINLTNKSITYQGREYRTLTELCQQFDVPFGTVYERIKNGWPESYWGVDKLPKAAPDFYFHLLSGGVERGNCFFYVVRLKRFTCYLKVGVAWSLALRRDREYGEELYLVEFPSRITALAFEQAVLSVTRNWMSCPSELLFAEKPWIGKSEVRKMEWDVLKEQLDNLLSELEEEGVREFALKHIPLNDRHRDALMALEAERSWSLRRN